MNARQFEAPAGESFPSSGRVFILLPESVGNKQDLGHISGAEELADGVSSVLQVPGGTLLEHHPHRERERSDTNPVG